jgi:hypothetical protein
VAGDRGYLVERQSRLWPNRIARKSVTTLMGDFQEAPGAPAAQGGLLGRLRPPDLLGLADRRRRDRLYRPLPPPDLEAREALQAPETNRSRPS